MLLLTCGYLAGPVLRSREVLVSLLAFFDGLLFFYFFRFPAVYVFAHELTHFLVAKLFRRRTGRFTLGNLQGSVQVDNPNAWIVLAPYFIPFYVIVAMGIFGLTQLFVFPSPPWAVLVFAFVVGLAYAYHCLMTVVAISHTQADLHIFGPTFSMALILVCNSAILLFAILLASAQWSRAWTIFSTLAMRQGQSLLQLFQPIP